MNKSLQTKVNISLTAGIFTITVLVILFFSNNEKQTVHQFADSETEAKLAGAERLLTVTNAIMLDRVASSMALLKQQAAALGIPSLGDRVDVNGRAAQNLLLGQTDVANSYELVDGVTKLMGGTATIFARSGESYVRISTNVMKNGVRATGTELAPDGKVIKLIRQKKPFYGQVDILGTPYVTGYEPIIDNSGSVIGIWYVGYKADLTELEKAISDNKIMTKGFLALVDDFERLRSHSGPNDKEVQNILDSTPADWNISVRPFADWNYQIVAAYPESEINDRIFASVIWIVAAGLVLGIMSIVVIGWFNRQLIFAPIEQAMSLANNIAQGRLNNQIDTSRDDEIGKLFHALAQMQQVLQVFMERMGATILQLSTASDKLAEISATTLSGVDEQRQQTDMAATAMNEMAATVAEVARSASHAAESTQITDQKANEGQQIVEKTMQIIKQLADEVNTATVTIRDLEQDSSKIGTVLEVIRGIAEQTNLLALNAAIEAARAGEAGRGFAVVADEVRTLATRTQDSTQEIAQIIEAIQQGAQKSVQIMEQNQQRAHSTVEQAQQASNSLSVITAAVGEMKDMNSQIASASEEQSVVAEEVNQNVTRIRDISEATSEGADETARATQHLADLSQDLNKMLHEFLRDR